MSIETINIEWITGGLLWLLVLGAGMLLATVMRRYRLDVTGIQWKASRPHLRVGDLLAKNRTLIVLAGTLLIALLAGWLFGEVAEEVLEQDFITRFDIAIGGWLLNHTTPGRSEFFYFITMLGSAQAIEAGVGLIGLWLGLRKKWRQLVTLVAATGSGILLNGLLKQIFARPRPAFANAYYQETSYSFPSGHAMMAVLFYGMVVYLLYHGISSWKWQGALLVTAVALATMIGLSRIFLGVHFLSDVVAGWAAGTFWLMTSIGVSEFVRVMRPRKDISFQWT